MSEIRNAVDAAYREMEHARSDLSRCRELCEHPGYRIGLWEWRVGSIQVKRLCTDCDDVVGDPSEDERAAFKSPFDEMPSQWSVNVAAAPPDRAAREVENG